MLMIARIRQKSLEISRGLQKFLERRGGDTLANEKEPNSAFHTGKKVYRGQGVGSK